MHCCPAEADELIMPDFGEAFDRSDAMLLTIPSASVGVEASDIRSIHCPASQIWARCYILASYGWPWCAAVDGLCAQQHKQEKHDNQDLSHHLPHQRSVLIHIASNPDAFHASLSALLIKVLNVCCCHVFHQLDH